MGVLVGQLMQVRGLILKAMGRLQLPQVLVVVVVVVVVGFEASAPKTYPRVSG